jgi:hypothetical protein
MGSAGRTIVALLLAGLSLGLSACETTADKSARLARENKFKLNEKAGLDVKQTSKQVLVRDTHLLSDNYGQAVVVELENVSGQHYLGVPIELTIKDDKGEQVFRNDTPGLDRALTHLAAIEGGEKGFWIYDQLAGIESGAKPKVVVGDGDPAKVKALPQFKISDTEVFEDPDGTSINGKIGNGSDVEQKDLVLYGIVRKGDKVVAAGTAQIEKLAPRRGARFQMFFIGDPTKGEVEYFVPPTAVT